MSIYCMIKSHFADVSVEILSDEQLWSEIGAFGHTKLKKMFPTQCLQMYVYKLTSEMYKL